jgi:glutamate-5-semialdehyde dehydrogenase
MAEAVRQIAAFADPLGQVIEGGVRPNGLEVRKIRVPLGVVLFIYESRPNVTTDAAALCVKSGNAVILRGGSEARRSNAALGATIAAALRQAGLPPASVTVVDNPDREAVGEFLKLRESIDVAIPRGGEALIRRVAAQATMPVLKHYLGVCHVYVDATADAGMAEAIVVNAKCQRPSVCNAAECLLLHADAASRGGAGLLRVLASNGVELRGCPRAMALAPDVVKPAAERDFGTEFGALVMAVKVVDTLDDALGHIARHGSGHTEAIVTRDYAAARRFVAAVDAAAVMVNASTRFNDGGEFGLGAEIGISTDKFHARGPCGLNELTSTKYVVFGDGHVRG